MKLVLSFLFIVIFFTLAGLFITIGYYTMAFFFLGLSTCLVVYAIRYKDAKRKEKLLGADDNAMWRKNMGLKY